MNTRMNRLFMKAARNGVAVAPIFCAYTNSAKEMSVFVGQTFTLNTFYKISPCNV